MTAPIPGGATRSGTPARTQASATSGVERPPNSFSITARPSSLPVTSQTVPADAETVLNDGAPPQSAATPRSSRPPTATPAEPAIRSGSNTEASSPVSHASRTALYDGGAPSAQAGSRAFRSHGPG